MCSQIEDLQDARQIITLFLAEEMLFLLTDRHKKKKRFKETSPGKPGIGKLICNSLLKTPIQESSKKSMFFFHALFLGYCSKTQNKKFFTLGFS